MFHTYYTETEAEAEAEAETETEAEGVAEREREREEVPEEAVAVNSAGASDDEVRDIDRVNERRVPAPKQANVCATFVRRVSMVISVYVLHVYIHTCTVVMICIYAYIRSTCIYMYIYVLYGAATATLCRRCRSPTGPPSASRPRG